MNLSLQIVKSIFGLIIREGPRYT